MLKKKRAFMALTLTIFPVSYFFSFLYYTDQLSTLLVLLMIHLSSRNYVALSAMAGKTVLLLKPSRLEHKILFSFFLGAYAVFTRQTNIVWVLWVAIMNSWEVLGEDLPKWIKIMLSKTPQPRSQKQKFKRKETMSGKSLIQANLVFASKCVVKMAPKVMPYTIIILGFLAFVIFNGGLVVGDRLAHEASLNLPQLFYFAFFVGFMLFPLMILYGTGKTLNQISKHRSVFLALIVASLVIVHFNTVVHPYLLADNRHYTFYVWKRLYEWYPISRYLLVPCYIVVWFWIWTYVRWDSVSFLAFFICLAVSIIPQKLMEYRYFILPYYVLRLNIKYSDWTHLGLECLLYVLVNAFTIYQFTMNPIVVHSQSTISRFMW